MRNLGLRNYLVLRDIINWELYSVLRVSASREYPFCATGFCIIYRTLMWRRKIGRAGTAASEALQQRPNESKK